ncbi:MAG: hypothetical protein K8R87_07265 [Verrucomicrobia bacterium]|nr:hypothetical protein [Verrucomicrobiota bacterium]
MGVLEGAPPVVIGQPPKTNAFLAYWRKVGGGSLMISLLIHVGLIALFVTIVMSIPPQEVKLDFLPGGGSKAGAEASSQLAHQVQQKKRTTMQKSTPMRKVVSASSTSQIVLPDVPIDAVDVPDMAIPTGGMSGSGGMGTAGAGGGFGTGRGIGGQKGFTSLPPSMKSRCSPVERLRKLKENGGSPECEKAVSSALEYLKSKQNPDGSWGKAFQPAMTGFALLCYFGRCETPDSPFYGDNIMKGILYLVEVSKSNPTGLMTSKANPHYAYEHGIATYALGEMYSLSRLGTKSLPGVKEAFEKGVKLIIEGQAPGGGWGYTYNKAGNDISVTGWQYQALKAAKLSGLKIDGLHGAIEKVVKNLEGLQTKDGGFGNTGSGAYNQWQLSGVGILGLQTFATNDSALIKKGLKFSYDFLTKDPPTWKIGSGGSHAGHSPSLYGWYYYAQCFFQNGGVEMKFWNETALPEILKNQNKDGSWTAGGVVASGGDNIMATALCTLMLEVYYRYLKVGDRAEVSVFDRGR